MPFFAQTTLTTERLALRWVDASDAAALFAIFSDRDVTRFWSSGPWTSIDQAHATISDILGQYEDGSKLRFAIVLKETGEMIGSMNLYDFHHGSRRCDIGYALAKPHWGKRYLTEAMAATLDYAFRDLNLNRIEADIDPRNEASARLLENMAFMKEGYMRERWIVNGEVCDTVNYGLLKRDWEAR